MHAQNTIVLRDLTLIENVSIKSMNVDGVTLEGGLRYSWADILQGSIEDKQIEFDSALTNIGLPLFRIRTRMQNRDHTDLQPLADSLLAQVSDSKGRTAYISWAAAFHHQLAQGNRAQAVLPLIQLLSIRSNSGELSELDTRLGLRFDEQGICLNLLPIWFDKESVSDALLKFEDEPLNSVSKVYLRSMQVEVPAWGNSTRFIDPESTWRPVLSAQSSLFTGNDTEAIETLSKSDLILTAAQRAIALYYLGLAQRSVQRSAQQNGSLQENNPELEINRWRLTMLQIPAVYQNQFPELAAAAIYQVVESLPESSTEFDSLREELTSKYGKTFFGRRNQTTRN